MRYQFQIIVLKILFDRVSLNSHFINLIQFTIATLLTINVININSKGMIEKRAIKLNKEIVKSNDFTYTR